LSRIVIDASVALGWCFPDEVSEYADAVLIALEGHEAVVPAIWPVEIANALLVGERRKGISAPDILRFGQLLNGLSLIVDLKPVAETLNGMLPIARAYNLSAYDAAYLDVAVRHGASLATLDAALQKAARAMGIEPFKV
jgi:predicted nucleic acid-binding protein